MRIGNTSWILHKLNIKSNLLKTLKEHLKISELDYVL